MATGFALTIGYVSGYTTDLSLEDIYTLMKGFAQYPTPVKWEETLKELPQSVRDMTDESGNTLVAYCNQYQSEKGNPLSFNDREMKIHVSCSGGGQSRKMKEIVAMAFCRMVIREMNVKHAVPIALYVS